MKPIVMLFLVLLAGALAAQENRQLAIGQPGAVVDLRTDAGTALLRTAWRYHPAHPERVSFPAPGPSATDSLALYPTGPKHRAYDLRPRAAAVDFDDSDWLILTPTGLEQRRGDGLLSFAWFRLSLTLPEHVGAFDVRGSTVVFEIVVDDYSEVWVNGRQAIAFGQSGAGAISGYNAPQRVFLTTDARPGQQFHIAILGINGPLGQLPENYIWVRSATLDFYRTYPPAAGRQAVGQVVLFDDELRQVLDPQERMEKLADGFQFTEGPVWHPDGYLLFSDPNANVIYRYEPLSRNVSIYHTKSGYAGVDIGEYHQPGSNGLAIDAQGRLLVCQHGNRRVVRQERKGPMTVIADRFDGKRLNSPNDLVIKSDGTIYFTDPPYGLPAAYDDARKELPFQGVYRVRDGRTELLSTDLGGPNGLAFSPDERYLYVGNWDIRDVYHTKTVWRFPVRPDGTLGEGSIFYAFDQTDEAEAVDGIKVDSRGYLFVSAPGGVWILNPRGRLLGKITGPERPANMAWGDADGRTLYLTAHTGLYRIRTLTGGRAAAGPDSAPLSVGE